MNPPTQHYAFGVSYLGSAYHGWQVQQQHSTVQGELEAALSKVADQPIHIVAAGRTDKGVHATGQVAGFATTAQRDPYVWLRALNGLTPDDIYVHWLTPVPANFHPRYSAVARRYRYVFADGKPNVFRADRAWLVREPGGDEANLLDADLMHRCAQTLVGEHDFSSFRGAGCQSLTPMRRVNFARVWRREDLVYMEIEANAFVLHMVRNIARGLVDASRQKDDQLMLKLLELRDRTALGPTAPATGLALIGVHYPDFVAPNGPLPAPEFSGHL